MYKILHSGEYLHYETMLTGLQDSESDGVNNGSFEGDDRYVMVDMREVSTDR